MSIFKINEMEKIIATYHEQNVDGHDSNGNPSRIYFMNGYMTTYTYSATGQKLAVEHSVALPNVTWAFGVKPDLSQHTAIFAGHTDYLLGGSLIVKEGTTRMLLFDGGYAKADRIDYTTYDYTLFYYTQDHLGNNREVLDTNGTLHQKTSYYPFGAPYAIPDGAASTDLQPYKYNGKELDLVHGLNTYDYGARQYYSILGRWDRVDPLCEKYYSLSPYNYCGNNPIKYIDINGDSIIVDNYGNLIGQNGKDKNVYLYSKKSNKYSKIGVLGGTIDVQKILPNALRKNASEARKLKKNLFADFAFIQKVKTGGDWDLKKNDKTIFGIDNKTRFLFNNSLMSGEDIGNMNYGVVSKAFGYSEEYAKRGAGLYQIIEGHSKPEWRSNRTSITSYRANQFGIVSSITISVIGPPYGDDPHDQYWIDQGYQFK